MDNLKEIIKKRKIFTVNSNSKYISTVNSNTVTGKFERFISENGIEPEGVAQLLAEGLDDTKSLSYYLILTKENSCSRLLEALSYTHDASQRKKIRCSKPVYFQGILRHWGIKTKFKKENH